jgi:hypothetical protein
MKCKTFEEAEQRYGKVDVTTCHWLDGAKWLKLFPIPDGFDSWKLLETPQPVRHIMLNIDAHEPLTQALEAIKAQGLAHLLQTFDGCFNIRLVRGSETLVSAHAYALAIDINAGGNKLGQTSGGNFDHPELIKCFTDQGWDFGGKFARPDPMHFSYCWE